MVTSTTEEIELTPKKDAMKKEKKTLNLMQCWALTMRSTKKCLLVKICAKTEKNERGGVVEYKARLFVCEKKRTIFTVRVLPLWQALRSQSKGFAYVCNRDGR